MKKGKDVRERRSNPRFKSLVMRWLQKFAEDRRTELTKLQVENFYDHLASWTDYQINTAFERCFVECIFFPNVKEVLDRMPEDRVFRGLVRTCELCKPDGWRIGAAAAGAPYRMLVRCDHSPDNAATPALDGWDKLYDTARELLQQQREGKKPSTQPRWPHLSKGAP